METLTITVSNRKQALRMMKELVVQEGVISVVINDSVPKKRQKVKQGTGRGIIYMSDTLFDDDLKA